MVMAEIMFSPRRCATKILKYKKLVARETGLEPATPGVTGRYSNQLSYSRASRSAAGPPDEARDIALGQIHCQAVWPKPPQTV